MKVLAFGIVKEIFGGHSVDIALEPGLTAAGLKDKLHRQYPGLSKLTSFMIAVNGEYAGAGIAINETDEVAIIPPVSGG